MMPGTDKKRVVIEAMAVGLPLCGLHEYAVQLCPRLIERCPEDMRLTFIVPKGFRGCFGEGAEYIEVTKLQAKLLGRIPMIKADLFHPLHQLCKLKRLPLAARTLLTVHDVNFVHTRTGSKYRHAESRFLRRLRGATHLAFISRFAGSDVLEHFPFSQPSRVIYNGVTPPDPARAARPAGVPDGPFLLHLSSLVPYKNPHLLIEMMDYLPDRTLVMAGRCKDEALKEMAAKRKNVVMTGEVNEEEKIWLYANCTAFLFPSIAEGFGLPPLEAMSMGRPAFLSLCTSLPEVGADKAYYWPELKPDKMAEVVAEKLSRPVNEAALRSHVAMFSWDATADAYIKYYKDILSGK